MSEHSTNEQPLNERELRRALLLPPDERQLFLRKYGKLGSQEWARLMEAEADGNVPTIERLARMVAIFGVRPFSDESMYVAGRMMKAFKGRRGKRPRPLPAADDLRQRYEQHRLRLKELKKSDPREYQRRFGQKMPSQAARKVLADRFNLKPETLRKKLRRNPGSSAPT